MKKRAYKEAFGPMEQEQSNKKSKISHELAQDRDTSSASAQLPKDVWSIITKNLHIYDVIFLRATSSALNKWCKEFKPFPKYFVLDQDKCMEYLVENGFTSLLDYVKNTLHFEWTPNLVTVAARSGQVPMLQHLVNNGLTLNDQLMLECTKHSCDLSMIKYLHENGVPWDCASTAQSYKSKVTIVSTTPMEYMAYHGHLDCIKYAMENGCTQRVINYTPSIECLDFAIQNGFTWQGERAQRGMASFAIIKKGICEEAARLGDLTMLKYAHQKGAPLKQSASQANLAGHLDCLIYASESESPKTYPVPNMSRTLDCFKYLVQADGGRLKDFYNMEMFWSDLVRIGNVETLRYLLANKFPIPTDPLSIDYSLAIDSCFSSAEMFKFILDEAKMSFEYVNAYLHCIAHSNLEGLKLCFERNLPNKSPAEIEAARPQEPRRLGIRAAPSNDSLVQQFIMKAIEATNVDVLKLLWEKFPNKEGLDMAKCLNGAARDSTPEICDFLTRHGAQWTSEHLRLTSILGNLPNMAYLTRMGCKWNGNACSPSNAMVYKYAREHGLTNINSSSK